MAGNGPLRQQRGPTRYPADYLVLSAFLWVRFAVPEPLVSEPFDVSLDLICTPTRTIRVRRRRRRPDGVLWDVLPEERRREMPILQDLYRRSHPG